MNALRRFQPPGAFSVTQCPLPPYQWIFLWSSRSTSWGKRITLSTSSPKLDAAHHDLGPSGPQDARQAQEDGDDPGQKQPWHEAALALENAR